MDYRRRSIHEQCDVVVSKESHTVCHSGPALIPQPATQGESYYCVRMLSGDRSCELTLNLQSFVCIEIFCSFHLFAGNQVGLTVIS